MNRIRKLPYGYVADRNDIGNYNRVYNNVVRDIIRYAIGETIGLDDVVCSDIDELKNLIVTDRGAKKGIECD